MKGWYKGYRSCLTENQTGLSQFMKNKIDTRFNNIKNITKTEMKHHNQDQMEPESQYYKLILSIS